MIRAVPLVAAVSLLVAACSSDGNGSAAAQKQAGAYACPVAIDLEKALGHSLADPKKSSTGSRTVLCAYTGATTTGTVIASVTFGASASDFDDALHALGDPDTTPVRNLGDKAATFSKDGVMQLIVRSGSRLFTVTSDPGDVASETAVARIFLR